MLHMDYQQKSPTNYFRMLISTKKVMRSPNCISFYNTLTVSLFCNKLSIVTRINYYPLRVQKG